MDQWIVIAGIAIIGLMAVAILQTIIGSLIRYVLFVIMAAAIMKWSNPDIEGYEFMQDLEVLQDLAVIGGIAFLVTLGAMMIFFQTSRVKIVLYPLIGFGATFAVWSVWPHIEAAWG